MPCHLFRLVPPVRLSGSAFVSALPLVWVFLSSNNQNIIKTSKRVLTVSIYFSGKDDSLVGIFFVLVQVSVLSKGLVVLIMDVH